jgi:hypothetical protein
MEAPVFHALILVKLVHLITLVPAANLAQDSFISMLVLVVLMVAQLEHLLMSQIHHVWGALGV